MSAGNTSKSPASGTAPNASQQHEGVTGRIFAIPAPLKRIFDHFPLVTYPENELPVTSPSQRSENALYIFTTPREAQLGLPSFNPTCLKWQTYLKFRGLSFHTVPSNNHSSPSGSLPFLIPASSSDNLHREALSTKKFKKWLASREDIRKEHVIGDARVEAYSSLLDQRIRKAWLFQLYLDRNNDSLMRDLYTDNASSSILVQSATALQLRQAAEKELDKASATQRIDEGEILRGAEEAFEALAMLLGGDEWFFGQSEPGLFDASVFAYTYLLTSPTLHWQRNLLGNMLQRFAGLMRHKERIMQEWNAPFAK